MIGLVRLRLFAATRMRTAMLLEINVDAIRQHATLWYEHFRHQQKRCLLNRFILELMIIDPFMR